MAGRCWPQDFQARPGQTRSITCPSAARAVAGAGASHRRAPLPKKSIYYTIKVGVENERLSTTRNENPLKGATGLKAKAGRIDRRNIYRLAIKNRFRPPLPYVNVRLANR